MPEKTYYSKTQACRFPFSFGGEAEFRWGRYVTANPREQEELDAIIPPRGNNPNIYTEDSLHIETAPVVNTAANALSEREVSQGDAAVLNVAAAAGLKTSSWQQTGPVTMASPTDTTHQSSMIPGINSQLGNIRSLGKPADIVGPGSEKFIQNAQEHQQQHGGISTADRIRAEAAARLKNS